MPILVQDVIDRMRNVGIDAQPNTDYYDDLLDLVPAIDSSVKWLISVINKARSENKATDEVVRELTQTRIYRTSLQSRIMFEDDLWTIDAVAPLCDTVDNTTNPPAPPASTFMSWYRSDLSFIRSYYSAYRKTIEETNQNRQNPFSPGFLPDGVTSSDLTEGSRLNITFCYVPSYDYIYPTVAAGSYIEILPEIPNKLCAIFLVKNHPAITATGDTILFPVSLFNLVYEKALQFVSYSQGDNTDIWNVTANDVALLVKSIS